MTLKEIAKELLDRAVYFEFDDPDARVEFFIDGLKIRCAAQRSAIERVALKFYKGLPHNGRTSSPITNRASNYHTVRSTIFRNFIDSGEVENALEYVALYENLSPLKETDRKLITQLRRMHDEQ